MTPRFIIFLSLAGFMAILLGCLTAAAFVIGPDVWTLFGESTATPVAAQLVSPRPTFTATPLPLPPTATLTPAPSPSPSPLPTATPLSTATSLPTETPVAEEKSTPLPTTFPPQLNNSPDPDPPEPTPAGVDFVIAQQRMRSNAENSWEEVIANGCGSDHTIYVTVLDAAGNPLNGVLVGDTYDNARAASGSAGLGKLEIELWSNTMSLEVKQDIGSGASYSSQQTLPLSAKDEDIPTEWLFEGGYCASMAECALRQQTNGLCRGHYSYDVTFQRTW